MNWIAMNEWINEWNPMNEWLNNINQFIDSAPNWYLFYKLKATSFSSYGSPLVTVWDLRRYTIGEGERESETEKERNRHGIFSIPILKMNRKCILQKK